MVAIRCLDEGVDVPKTESAYILASSSSPRQFIQRRGRVLRLSPGKKFASIYDFITIPDFDRISNNDQQAYNIERSLIKREIERVNEFAGIAINQGESLKTLREIRKRYNLMDF